MMLLEYEVVWPGKKQFHMFVTCKECRPNFLYKLENKYLNWSDYSLHQEPYYPYYQDHCIQ